MAVRVRGRIAHQSNTATIQGLVKLAVLLDGHHPTAIQSSHGLRLFGNVLNRLVNLASLDGVVIDRSPRNAESGSDVGLTGILAVRATTIAWIGAEQNQHG